MSKQEKILFHKLIKKFGADKAMSLYNEFRAKIKADYVDAFTKDSGANFVHNIEPKLFKEFVNEQI